VAGETKRYQRKGRDFPAFSLSAVLLIERIVALLRFEPEVELGVWYSPMFHANEMLSGKPVSLRYGRIVVQPIRRRPKGVPCLAL